MHLFPSVFLSQPSGSHFCVCRDVNHDAAAPRTAAGPEGAAGIQGELLGLMSRILCTAAWRMEVGHLYSHAHFSSQEDAEPSWVGKSFVNNCHLAKILHEFCFLRGTRDYFYFALSL